MIVVFKSSTLHFHRVANIMTVVQAGIFGALACLTIKHNHDKYAKEGTWNKNDLIIPITALISAGLFFVLRKFESRTVMRMALKGTGKTVEIDTLSAIGTTVRKEIDVSKFLERNQRGSKFWVTAYYQKKPNVVDHFLFERSDVSSSHAKMFDKIVSGRT